MRTESSKSDPVFVVHENVECMQNLVCVDNAVGTCCPKFDVPLKCEQSVRAAGFCSPKVVSFDSQMCNAQNMQKAVDAAADSCCIVDCSKYICLDVLVPVSDVSMCARESSQIDYTRGNGKNGNCESSIFVK